MPQVFLLPQALAGCRGGGGSADPADPSFICSGAVTSGLLVSGRTNLPGESLRSCQAPPTSLPWIHPIMDGNSVTETPHW